jgi:hypothetical protein
MAAQPEERDERDEENEEAPLGEFVSLSRRAARDLARGMDAERARWLVDYYYAIQDFRIQSQGEVRAVEQGFDEGSFEIGKWIAGEMKELEATIKSSLGAYALAQPAGEWAMSITGIGPVIAAGLLAHIDIEKAPTAGHIWRFAGLDPSVTWDKGQKRPWNASLKVLCWKIGDSFVKNRNRATDIYGKVYAERKAWESERNDRGVYAEAAAKSLATRKFKDVELRKLYESGRLPAGRIELRARRYATKLFLSHYQHVAYVVRFGEEPPKPYALTHLEHSHFIAPPNWPMA